MGQPGDSLAAHFPVSIKGVVFKHDRAILLRNERDEEVGLFRVPELDGLPMPEGYRASVRRWGKHCLPTG